MITMMLMFAQVVAAAPLSPAAAVAVLRASHSLADRTDAAPRTEGPNVAIAASSPTAGPYGEFEPFSPSRCLDGTLRSQPPRRVRAYVARPLGIEPRASRRDHVAQRSTDSSPANSPQPRAQDGRASLVSKSCTLPEMPDR